MDLFLIKKNMNWKDVDEKQNLECAYACDMTPDEYVKEDFEVSGEEASNVLDWKICMEMENSQYSNICFYCSRYNDEGSDDDEGYIPSHMGRPYLGLQCPECGRYNMMTVWHVGLKHPDDRQRIQANRVKEILRRREKRKNIKENVAQQKAIKGSLVTVDAVLIDEH